MVDTFNNQNQDQEIETRRNNTVISATRTDNNQPSQLSLTNNQPTQLGLDNNQPVRIGLRRINNGETFNAITYLINHIKDSVNALIEYYQEHPIFAISMMVMFAIHAVKIIASILNSFNIISLSTKLIIVYKAARYSSVVVITSSAGCVFEFVSVLVDLARQRGLL